MINLSNITATDPFQFFDQTLLSHTFRVIIEDGKLAIDNTSEEEGLEFEYDNTDKVEVIIQRNYAFVMKMSGENFHLSILNIGIDGTIKALQYFWGREHHGLPKRDRSDDFYWPSYIALLLVTDVNNGSPTFRSPYVHHIGFIMRKIANRSGKLPLMREFEKSNLRFTLLNGSFQVSDFAGNLLFVTSDFRKLNIGMIRQLMHRVMLKSA